MDSHIKNWLSFIKTSNKKRKLEQIDEDELIKELKYYSIITIIKILKQHKFNQGGIVHAFSGGVEEAKTYAKLGFKLGIGGSLTYPQAKRLHSVVNAMHIESLVIETDAPDMIPMPHRQQNAKYTRNSPAYLASVAQALAQAKQLSLQQLAPILWQNSCQALHLTLQSARVI